MNTSHYFNPVLAVLDRQRNDAYNIFSDVYMLETKARKRVCRSHAGTAAEILPGLTLLLYKVSHLTAYFIKICIKSGSNIFLKRPLSRLKWIVCNIKYNSLHIKKGYPDVIGVCFIQKTSLMVKTDLVLERVKGF